MVEYVVKLCIKFIEFIEQRVKQKIWFEYGLQIWFTLVLLSGGS